MDRILMIMKSFDPRGFICPRPGAKYLYTAIYTNMFIGLYIRSQVSVIIGPLVYSLGP